MQVRVYYSSPSVSKIIWKNITAKTNSHRSHIMIIVDCVNANVPWPDLSATLSSAPTRPPCFQIGTSTFVCPLLFSLIYRMSRRRESEQKMTTSVIIHNLKRPRRTVHKPQTATMAELTNTRKARAPTLDVLYEMREINEQDMVKGAISGWAC